MKGYEYILLILLSIFFLGLSCVEGIELYLLKEQVADVMYDNYQTKEKIKQTEEKCQRMTDECINILSNGIWDKGNINE